MLFWTSLLSSLLSLLSLLSSSSSQSSSHHHEPLTGIWAPNCSEWTVTQFATAKIGAIIVNINPAYQRSESHMCCVVHAHGCMYVALYTWWCRLCGCCCGDLLNNSWVAVCTNQGWCQVSRHGASSEDLQLHRHAHWTLSRARHTHTQWCRWVHPSVCIPPM
jgi:hypothetical protein